MNRRPLVYIAGPYSKGDKLKNVHNAIAAGEKVFEKGGLPLVPHLSHFWDQAFPKPIEWWYAYDNELLKRCRYLVRLMGESHGADNEVLLALGIGIKVYSTSEVWHGDFRFPEETLAHHDELAARAARLLPPCFDRG